MELREYGRILWRRVWVVALLLSVGVIAGFGPAINPPRDAVRYDATIRMIISFRPEPRTGNYYGFNDVYTFQSSEYLADDFSEVIKSQAFADDVRRELAGTSIEPQFALASARTQKTHRILSLTVSGQDSTQTQKIATAAVQVIDTKGKDYFAQLQSQQAMVRIIDGPTVSREQASRRLLVDAMLRAALGLLAGLGLAFLLHYLDSALYDADEAEAATGARVLGQIPPARPRRWPWQSATTN